MPRLADVNPLDRAVPCEPSLRELFADAAHNTYFMSETDSQPVFVSTSFAADKALTGEHIMAAFTDRLASAFGAGDLAAYTFELSTDFESALFLKELGRCEPGDEDYIKDNARGFSRIRKVFADHITDLRVMRVGPRAAGATEMGVDQGAYQYLVVGRTRDGHLAGIAFESVET